MKVIWFSQKKNLFFFFFLAEKLGFFAQYNFLWFSPVPPKWKATLVSLFLRFPKFLSNFFGIEIGVFFTNFFNKIIPSHPPSYPTPKKKKIQGGGGDGGFHFPYRMEKEIEFCKCGPGLGFTVFHHEMMNMGGDHACLEGFWGGILGSLST